MSFRRQLQLLRTAPSFRALFLATGASGVGTYLALLALIVDVYDRTHSAAWVSALLIVEFLPILVIGLALGPLVDRFPRRSLMIGSDLLRFGIFLALPFAPNALTIVVLAAFAGLATGFFRPAVYAGLPNLVAERDLPAANSLLQAVESVAALVPILGGAIVAATGPDVNYVINAFTFLASAALLLTIPAARLQERIGATRGHVRDLKEGFEAVIRSRPLVTVLVAWTVAEIAVGAANVSWVVLAKDALEGGDFGFGVLMAASGLGLLVGSLLGGPWLERRRIAEAYASALAMMAIGSGLAAIAPSVWPAALFVTILGVGNGVAVVCNAVLVQRGARDEVRGRAFTVIMSVNAAALGLSMAAAGPFTDAAGARWVWGFVAGIYAIAAALGLALARPIRSPARADVTVAPVAGGAAAAPPP